MAGPGHRQQMAGEWGNVHRPVAQRRQGDAHGGQPVPERFIECPALHQRRHVAGARHDEPHIERQALGAAPPRVGERVNHLVQRRLRDGRERVNVLEVERPALREFKDAVAMCPGLFVAALDPDEFEELRGRIGGGAVEVHERARRSGAVLVQQTGHERLPRAGLARDEHGHGARGELVDHGQHGRERRVLRDERGHRGLPFEAGAQMMIVAHQQSLFPGAPHERLDFRHAVRLRQKVVRPELERREGGLDGPVAGDDDELRGQRFLADEPQHLEPVDFGHDHVHQHDIERLGAQQFERRTPIAHDPHGEPAGSHELLKDRPEVGLVLGDEDANGAAAVGACSSRRCVAHTGSDDVTAAAARSPVGSVTRKLAPCPSADTSSSTPLCSPTMP